MRIKNLSVIVNTIEEFEELGNRTGVRVIHASLELPDGSDAVVGIDPSWEEDGIGLLQF